MPESVTNLSHSIMPTTPLHLSQIFAQPDPAQSASAVAESTSRPFGKSSSFISRVVDTNRMRRFKAMRSETVGAEACFASCPTAYCKSGRSTDRNNKRPHLCSEVRLLFSFQRSLVYDSIFHTSRGTLPCRVCQPQSLAQCLRSTVD